MTSNPLSRRTLLSRAAALAASRPAAAGALVAAPLAAARAAPLSFADGERLALHNLHTGEQVDVVLHDRGRRLPDAKAEIDRVLRDHRSGDVHPIDDGVLDQLLALRQRLGLRQPFDVISGYRSPATNARLAAASDGVARTSLHMQGRAVDIRAPGLDLRTLHRAALELGAGGVGYYAKSNFVHVDTGRVRRWGG